MPVFLRWLLRLGPLNPITVRLVQNGSRRPRHLYIRSAYLAVLIIVLLWTLLIGTSSSSISYGALASAGAKSFTWIAFLQVTLICVLAPVFMAGAIAQEASPRTWEVLLSTPLTALQIVLGNLLGRLFFILALLFASLPLFALTQYFGGVPGRSIVMCYMVAACAAVLVGSIAIALSVSRLVGKRAVFAFYVAVVSYLAISFGIDRALTSTFMPGVRVTYMTAINPFLALHSLLNPTTYNAAPPGSQSGILGFMLERPVASWCWLSGILSVLLVGVSTFTVRAGGLGTFTGDNGVPWYRKMFGLAAAGSEHRAPRAVWTNPIAWREAAARNATLGRIAARWTFIALGGIFGIGLVAWYHWKPNSEFNHTQFRMSLLLTVLGELAVTALVAVNMAATAVSREREDGTLDLLLTTPITPGQYLTGKLRGLIAYLLPLLAVPLGTLAIAGIYTLFGGLERTEGVLVAPSAAGGEAVPVVLPEAAIVAPLVVIPFIAFCVVVGLQWSLKSKGTIGSVVATVGVVGVISSLVGVCGWSLGKTVPVVGPIISAVSPATAIFGLVDPTQALEATVAKSLTTARLCLFIGAVVAAGIYSGIVYGIHANMVRTFDMTVRRLAGNR